MRTGPHIGMTASTWGSGGPRTRRLGEAVAARALQEAEHPIDDRLGAAVPVEIVVWLMARMASWAASASSSMLVGSVIVSPPAAPWRVGGRQGPSG